MAFLPWKPIQLQGTPAAVAAEEIAAERGVTSQQVVKNVLLTPERTLGRKMREAILARRIEAELSKDEIARLESAAAPTR